MKTKMIFLALTLVALFSVNSAFSQNPHFLKPPVFTDNGTTLTATGSIVGLGANITITVILTTTGTATTECTNPGGNVAPGQTKTGAITVSGDFTSDKNGRVNYTLTTNAPAPGPCPNGQWTGRVTGVTFVNSSVTFE
ncbi:hypothetical protein AAE02nite_47060 [Adhaeribacter aerolatus]|uniref:Uncharacterized protein n=1 Tax=Adhaeribacter aerolatus TaxID=670289 RepID=A0A512B501_9BACT|nr:hypothetical protein AAE02nite_47060 [Adhaeribacter aerolatus]